MKRCKHCGHVMAAHLSKLSAISGSKSMHMFEETYPCAVQICSCTNFEEDPTGTAKPR